MKVYKQGYEVILNIPKTYLNSGFDLIKMETCLD